MTAFIDLHCHWVAHIDDGARTPQEGIEMLELLGQLGFAHVVATPHIRPGMFDNSARALREAYGMMSAELDKQDSLPETSLGAEHFFDSTVIERIHQGDSLPYRADEKVVQSRMGGAILIEFHDLCPQNVIERQLFELQTKGFIPVIAHPERYRCSWKQPDVVERLVALGSVALLDSAALVGKYGRRPQKCAKELLERGVYDAACSDAHRPKDVPLVARAIEWIRQHYGEEELELLFSTGPQALLNGQRPANAS